MDVANFCPSLQLVGQLCGEMVLPPGGFVAKWEWGAWSSLWCL